MGGTAIPPIDPPPPKWHPPPPSGKALYDGLESGLGIGEGVPISFRCRGAPYRWQGVGTVRAAKESITVGRRPGSILHQVRNHPSASCAVGLVGTPRSARYDNAYYQTMTPSPGGWDLGRHRLGLGRVFHQVRMPGASSIRSGRAVGLGLQRAPSQLRSGLEPGRWNRWPVRPCRPRLGADGEPSDLASSPLRLREPSPCAHPFFPALLVSDRDRFFQASAWHDSD